MCYFCSLHIHTESSLLDGAGKPQDFAKTAKEMGFNAIGKSDHGNTCQNYLYYLKCKEEGVKPILGCEVYFEPEFSKEKMAEEKNRGSYSHLTLFAENNLGYENLNKIVTAANRDENYYYKPVTDWEILKKNKDGIIILSGCILSKIGRYLRKGEVNAAEAIVDSFYKEFGDNYYMEVMPPFISEKNATDEDLEFHKFNKDYNNFIIAQGKRINRPVIMTTDVHYPKKENWSSYRVMRYMAQDKYPDSHYKFRYLMGAEDIIKYWNKYMDSPCEGYLENTGLIVERSNVVLDFKTAIPKIDWGEPSKDKLTKLAVKGLKKLGKFTDIYKDRLVYELNTILEKGFEDYFLLCYKIIQEAKDKNIGQGFGRGSVCGSVLAYALGITGVDPIHFDISFDRFLRPNKNAMPDVDMDFDSRGQHYIMNYLLNEFNGRATRICNFGRYKARNLFNDLVKYYQLTDEQKASAEGIKELLFTEVEEKENEDYQELLKNKRIRDFDAENKNFVKHFCNLHGQIKFIGKHAAGVALTDKPYSYYDAIMQSGKEFISSHDMAQIDSMNIVKMDILGLNNISVIKDIELVTGAKFTYECLDDPDVYKAFREKKTTGIFQFDSWSSEKVLQAIQPQNILELMACNAVNRPGPDLEPYVKGKFEGVDENTFWYPYTKDTYGAVIYQDQLLNICRNVAGLDWDTTDKIVKNTSKKIPENLAKLKGAFVDGCVNTSGIKKKVASEWYDKNTLYGFPKAHACGYTLLSAYCMWLKIKYPAVFWWALLKNEDNEDNRAKYASCAIREGIFLFPAHLNAGMEYELITKNEQLGFEDCDILEPGDMAIREGLGAIKGLGPKTSAWISANRPWKSKEHFIETVNNGNKRSCNKASLEKLEEHGALDFDLDNYIERMIDYNSKIAKRHKKYR